MHLAAGVNAPVFNENVLSFAVAYGLAVQGVGADPHPDQPAAAGGLAASALGAERPWFAAAAALLVASLGVWTWRSYADRDALADSRELNTAIAYAGELGRLQNELEGLLRQGDEGKGQVGTFLNLYGYRQWWPTTMSVLSRSLVNVFDDQPLLGGTTAQERQQNLEKLRQTPRHQRNVMFVQSLEAEYVPDLSAVKLDSKPGETVPEPIVPVGPPGQPKRGFKIVLTGQTPLPEAMVDRKLIDLTGVCRAMADKQPLLAIQDVRVLGHSRLNADDSTAAGSSSSSAAQEAAGPLMPDPLFPDEDMAQDTKFEIGWLVSIEGDGLPTEPQPGQRTNRENVR